MKKYQILSLIVILIASISLVIADKSDSTKQNHNSNGKNIIPADAVEVFPDVFSLGTKKDKDGNIVDGFLFVDKKKAAGNKGERNAAKTPTNTCYSLFAKGARWKITEQYITGSGIDPALTETSLDAWDKEVSFDIFGTRNAAGVTDGIDTVNPDGKNEVMLDNLGPTDTVAYTIVWGVFYGPVNQRRLVEWDAVFNSAYNFGNANINTGVMDYQNVATHEFGHALGLAHPGDSCTEETMFRFVDLGETKKRSLNTGDIVGVKVLYN